jgi:hypothetical protein
LRAGVAGAGGIPLSWPDRHDQALITSEFAVPQLCHLKQSSAVLDSAGWAIACHIDGRVTVGELAERGDIPLHEAIGRVNRLITSGLCTVTAVAAPGYDDGWPSADSRLPLLPRRVPAAVRAAPESRRARLDLGLLRQILDGLNALD